MESQTTIRMIYWSYADLDSLALPEENIYIVI